MAISLGIGVGLTHLRGVTLGPELVANGGFDTDTVWTKGAGWTIGGGVATKTSGNANDISQSITFTAGKSYQLTYDLTRSSGGITPQFLGGTVASGAFRNTSGTYTDIVAEPDGGNIFRFVPTSTFSGSIDNVSIREINP